MLIGTYYPAMDTKGRVNFPAKLRESLGDFFYITKGIERCLYAYPEEEWKKLEEKINALPLSKGHKLQRYFFSGAGVAEPDAQGRINIPPPLREFAGLNKELVILGASNRAEIWDAEIWAASADEVTQAALLEMMDEVGF